MNNLDLIQQASNAAPHRLYGPIATLVQDALAHAENVAGFALVPGAIKPGGTAERQINGGIALAKAVLAMPPLGVSGEDRSEPTPAPRPGDRVRLFTPDDIITGVLYVGQDGKQRVLEHDRWGHLVDVPGRRVEVVSPEGTS